MINAWGPAILVCLTIVVGLFYSNARITDLRNETTALRNDMSARFEAMEKRFNGRFDDLKDWIRAELRRLEERSSPIQRG